MKEKIKAFAIKLGKALLNLFVHFIVAIWQLPQNLAGLCALVYYDGGFIERRGLALFFMSDKMPTGSAVTLGSIIILSSYSREDAKVKRHEYGHYLGQSLLLGWLYLPEMGVRSIIHAAVHDKVCKDKNYYHYWVEKWATKVGEWAENHDWTIRFLNWLKK